MTSSPATHTLTPLPGPKSYSAPSVASLPYHQRPLPPGWISQFDTTHQANFYINEGTNPPTVTWEDPRPAYYMAQERGQYAPPPGIEGRPPVYHIHSSQPQQQVQQQQQYGTVQTVQSDGTITINSNGQPVHIVHQSIPQQQQQQQQQASGSNGMGVGRAIVGAAVVTSLLRPRPRVVVAPRRRRF